MMRRRMAYRFLMDLSGKVESLALRVAGVDQEKVRKLNSAGDARGLASHYAEVLGEDDEHTVYAATLAAFLDEEE